MQNLKSLFDFPLCWLICFPDYLNLQRVDGSFGKESATYILLNLPSKRLEIIRAVENGST